MGLMLCMGRFGRCHVGGYGYSPVFRRDLRVGDGLDVVREEWGDLILFNFS